MLCFVLAMLMKMLFLGEIEFENASLGRKGGKRCRKLIRKEKGLFLGVFLSNGYLYTPPFRGENFGGILNSMALTVPPRISVFI